MRQVAEFIAVLACGLFAGAALYVSLVEHPARMECGVELAVTEFRPSYRRATVMQASMAGVGLLSSIAAWFAGAGFLWVVGGVLLGSVIPFTLIVILPTNNQLLSPCTGQTVSTNRAATRPLGHVACRKKYSQWSGGLPFPRPLKYSQNQSSETCDLDHCLLAPAVA